MFSPPPPHPGLRTKKPSLELPPQIPAGAAAAAVASGSKHSKRRKSGSGSSLAAAFSPRRLLTAIGTKPYSATTHNAGTIGNTAGAATGSSSTAATYAGTSTKGAVPQGMHNEGYCARELLHRSESGSKGSMSGSGGSSNSLQGLSASARRGQQRQAMSDTASSTGVRAMSAKAALGRQFFDESADDNDQDTSNDDHSVERSYVHGSNSSLETGALYIYTSCPAEHDNLHILESNPLLTYARQCQSAESDYACCTAVIVQPLFLTDMHENSDRYTDTSHFSQQSSPALTPTAAASGSSKSKRLSWLTNAFKLRSRHHSTAAAAAAAVQAQNRAALGRSGSSSDLQNSGQLTAPAANSRSFFALEFPDDELEAVLQSNPQYNRTNPTPSTHSQRRSITTSASFGASGSGSMHRLRDGSNSNSASTSCHSAADAGARLSSGSWHNYTQHPQQHHHSSAAAAADSSDAGSDSGSVSTVAGPPVTGHGVAWGVSSNNNNNSNNNSSSSHSNIGGSA
eukprot:7843-Heterococcus_DN1.PRE.2